MDTRTKEAVRYLGYGRHAVDDHTLALVESSFQGTGTPTSAQRIIYRIFDFFQNDGCLQIGQMNIESKNLTRIEGCGRVAIFGATWGRGGSADAGEHLLWIWQRQSGLQACAAALLEEYCDDWQERSEKNYPARAGI